MNDTLFYIIIGIAGIGLLGILIWYFILSKSVSKADIKYAKELKKGTEKHTFSLDVIYQKLYVSYTKIPFLKRYLAKLRRKLEILNVDDEYLTRKQSASILTKTLCIIFPLTIAIIAYINPIITYSIPNKKQSHPKPIHWWNTFKSIKFKKKYPNAKLEVTNNITLTMLYK